MTVTAIRLQNFMAFDTVPEDSDDGWVELKPITLLFGMNSSGKSVIMRALRFLKQSLYDSPEGRFFAYSVIDGTDVGSFAELAHRREEESYHFGADYTVWPGKSAVSFEFRLEMPVNFLAGFQLEEIIFGPTCSVELRLDYGWLERFNRADIVSLFLHVRLPEADKHLPQRLLLLEAVRLHDGVEELALPEWVITPILEVERDDEGWDAAQLSLKSSFLPILEVQGIIREKNYPMFKQIWQIERDVLRSLREAIVSFLESIRHIRPLRPDPKRYYVLDDVQMQRWQQQGLGNFLNLLQQGETDQETLDKLEYWLEELQLGVQLIPKPMSSIRERASVSQLLVDESKGGVEGINITDLGFGTSQVLPVLIETLLAKEGDTLLIEQPELHLHPRAQAYLMDMFIAATKNGVKFVIETHSESVLLRLQRRVIETTSNLISSHEGISADELAILCVSRHYGESKVYPVKISKLGELEKVPSCFEGFFSNDLEETAELLRSQLIVKMKE